MKRRGWMIKDLDPGGKMKRRGWMILDLKGVCALSSVDIRSPLALRSLEMERGGSVPSRLP